MSIAVTEIATCNQCDDFHYTTGCAVEERLISCVAERHDELGEEIADTAVWNIGCDSIEHECPGQWIRKGFFELVRFEMLITNALLINTDALNSKAPIIFTQPAGIELVIWHEIKEEAANDSGQEACN